MASKTQQISELVQKMKAGEITKGELFNQLATLQQQGGRSHLDNGLMW